jgi:predicted nuclease of predicted toxin-antitoxin system
VRFFADECVDMRIVRILRRAGYEVLEPAQSARGGSDIDVLSAALDQNAVLLTEDSDFGALLFRDGLTAIGVFYFRCDDPQRCAAAVIENLDAVAGSIVVVTDHGVRVRPLQGGAF